MVKVKTLQLSGDDLPTEFSQVDVVVPCAGKSAASKVYGAHVVSCDDHVFRQIDRSTISSEDVDVE